MKQCFIVVVVLTMFAACKKEGEEPQVKGGTLYVLDSKTTWNAPVMYDGSHLVTNQDSIKAAAVIDNLSPSAPTTAFKDPFFYGPNPVDSPMAEYTTIRINGDSASIYTKNMLTKWELSSSAKVEQRVDGDMILTYIDSTYSFISSAESLKYADSINMARYTVYPDYVPTYVDRPPYYTLSYVIKLVIKQENGQLYIPVTTIMYRSRTPNSLVYNYSSINAGVRLPFNEASLKNVPENSRMIVQTGKIRLIKQ